MSFEVMNLAPGSPVVINIRRRYARIKASMKLVLFKVRNARTRLANLVHSALSSADMQSS